jgi:hypothetical protein
LKGEKRVMKNLLILFSILLFVLCGLMMVEAKPYKPIAGEGDYEVDIPDDVVLPFDLSNLKLESTQFFQLTDELVLVVILYSYPDFVFVSESGDQVNPYIEVFRWVIGKGLINFCSFSFINSSGYVEAYADGEFPSSSPSGKFKKIEIEKYKTKMFKKIPITNIYLLEKKGI